MTATRVRPCGVTVWVVGVLVALALGPLAPQAEAQAPGLTLVLTPSHSLIAPGGTLRVTIGAINQGPPVAMDIYIAVLLPDGDSIVVPLGAGGFGSGRMSQLGTLTPLVAGATLPTGFTQSINDFLVYTFTGNEPAGTYRFFLAAVRPRGLVDGRVDAGDLLALATAQVTFGPPLGVTADGARAASAEITPLDGGTVQATGADGTIYTLSVPPGAVGAVTTVTLTPVTAVTGVPGMEELLAAVRGEPAGLVFARPARLTIEMPGGVPPTARAGLLVADDGTGAEFLQVLAGPTRIELELTHFSTLAVPMDLRGLLTLLGAGTRAEQGQVLLASAWMTDPPNPVAVQFLLDHLLVWYDTVTRPLLQAGQVNAKDLLVGLREFVEWDRLRRQLEELFGSTMLGLSIVRGRLTGRAEEGRDLLATGFGSAFTRANERCRTGTTVAARLTEAEIAARRALLVRDTLDSLALDNLVFTNDIDLPSPGLANHGLDAATVATTLCARAVISNVTEPPLGPGQSGNLTVEAGLSLAGAAPVIHSAIAVVLSPDPGSSGTPAANTTSLRRTNAAGLAAVPVTASPAGSLDYLVCGVFHPQDFAGLFAAQTVGRSCRSSSGGVVVTPSQTTITPGESRQFTALVENTAIQDVVWAVVNGAGGTVTQTGLFTSNGTLGTFVVTATSVANPDSVGIAQVTVADPPHYRGTLLVFIRDSDGTVIGQVPTEVTVTVGPADGQGTRLLSFELVGGCAGGEFFITLNPGGGFSGPSRDRAGFCFSGNGSSISGIRTAIDLEFTIDDPFGVAARFEGVRLDVP